MKLAIIAPLVSAIREPQQGGSQAFVSDLARGLGARGHEVHVYAARGSQVPGVTVIDTGIDPSSLAATLYRASGSAARDSAGSASAFASVYSRVRETKYDVMHNHAFDAPAIELASELGLPIVHTLHLPPDAAIAAALRDAARQASPPSVAAVSAFQARGWSHVVTVNAILPPYVPTRTIPWSAAAGEGVVFAGRLSPEKGAAEAIEIAQAAGIAIDLYGDTYDAEYARQEIDPRRKTPGVTIHAGVPRATLWTVMARAAVVLCPAKWDEPFGMAAAESQACGTPVVAFKRGGLGEMIADNVTGYLVAPDDISAATDSVMRAGDISRSACRDHAESHLDLERSLDAHEQLYERVVTSGAGAAVRE